MQLLVIYHWIESHCCSYLFNDVLFPAGHGLWVTTSFPCDKRGPSAQTPYSRDLAGSPVLRPGVSHPSSLREKDIISKKHSYHLCASEGGVLCLKAH